MRLVPYTARTNSTPTDKSRSFQTTMGASESCITGEEERKDGIMGTSSLPEQESSPSSSSRTWRASQHPEASREFASASASDLSASVGSRSGHHPYRWIHRKARHEQEHDREQPDNENTLASASDLSTSVGSRSGHHPYRWIHRKAQHEQEQPDDENEPTLEPKPQPEPEQHQQHSVLNLIRRGSSKVVHKTSHAVTHLFTAIENSMFPRIHGQDHHHTPAVRVRGGVMLDGCENAEEHYAMVEEIMLKVKGLHGDEGLEAAGFEYRFVPCDEHAPIDESLLAEIEECDGNESDEDAGLSIEELSTGSISPLSLLSQPDLVATTVTSNSVRSTESLYDLSVHTPPPTTCSDSRFCHVCMRRLFHTKSNTMVNESNRKKFVADGNMYEEIARLCQEKVHELMCEEGNLEWVTISEDETGQGKEPIRALVNRNHPLIRNKSSDSEIGGNGSDGGHGEYRGPPLIGRPTLLIATGKGKVRAGIFSRQHLICSGIESATALPIVREAVMRKLNVVMIDPNVHGDSLGMVTFEKTMAGLFGRWESNDAEEADDECAQVKPLQSRDLYILSHSASGSQLARYLLDKSSYYLPHIRAIAFTDSTHNVQWCKTAENDDLYRKLQSPECVYFRCASVPRDGKEWYLHRAGEQATTDNFWKHRFGTIKTYWAGTDEHSLTNWYAHGKIWEHFDRFLGRIDEVPEALEKKDQEAKVNPQKALPVDS